MSASYDPFRPKVEPARAIYEGKDRAVDVWIGAELQAVFVAAQQAADRHELRKPSLAEIESAERYARGSVDYGAKWACQVVEGMRKELTA